MLAAGLLAVGLLAAGLHGTPSAIAAPGDRAGDARSAHEAAAAEVAAVQARVTEAEQTLQRMTIEAEAASGAALAAQAALTSAHVQAMATAAELSAARGAVDRTQEDVADLGREAYMGSDESFGDVALLLDADSPTEVLQQAATLEVLGEQRSEQLEELEVVEAQEARIDREARAAVAEQDRAAREAEEAASAAEAQLSAAQGTYDALAAEKAALDAQLREAEIRLLEIQGAPDAVGTWAGLQAAEESANLLTAAGGAVAPTKGRVTSCYGSRWGTLHAGVDIAAPIGTPVFSPESGVVLDAGPASGFGLAVYVQHGDGTVTLYGHINQFFVTPGQVVEAGQQIAEVGNRGQSTGPHLHFEVHDGGLYASRVNPTPWLDARGISLGGC
ncbi:MAG: M23 family metallopeptidase [Actinomycetota bacterium]|nr:M23 family metallopeptidase [Actinomycetota bacterium]